MMTVFETILSIFAVIFSVVILFVAMIPFGRKIANNIINAENNQFFNNAVGYCDISFMPERSTAISHFLISIFDRVFAFLSLLVISPILFLVYFTLTLLLKKQALLISSSVNNKE
jgi:hypothetical protein